MEMNIKQFFDFIGVEYVPINMPHEDNNMLTMEEIQQYKKSGARIQLTQKGMRINIRYDINKPLVSAYLKHSDSVYCLDIDVKDEAITNEQIHSKIKECFGVLPPYTLSRTKQRPHYYFRLENIPEYSNEVNIFKFFEADLISKKKNMWELTTTSINEFYGELPTLQWDDIKQHFNVDKMNNIKTVKPIEVKETVTESPKESPKAFNSKYDKMVLALDARKRAYDYDNWFKLLMLCKNLNINYETFETVSKNSGYASFNSTDCKSKWDGYVAKSERLYGYSTLREWLIEDDEEAFERIEVGDAVSSLLKNPTHENSAHIYKVYNSGEIFYSSCVGFMIFDKTTSLWKINVDENIIKNNLSLFFKQKVLKRVSLETKRGLEEDVGNIIKDLGMLLRTIGTDSWLKGTVALLKGKLMEEGEDVFKKLQTIPSIISFSNGICYDFKLGKSRQIVKEDYQTQTTGYPWKDRNESDVQIVKKLIEGLHDNPDMTKALLSSLACSLYGENINEKFFILTGEGRNGKSTVETLFKTALGGYYASINNTQLTRVADSADKANSEIAKLQFCRCVMTGEPESTGKDDKLKISTIKRWTGRDPITVRALYKDSFTFDPQFTLYLLCNEIPQLSDVDGGITERMRIINFPFKFTGVEGEPLEKNQKVGNQYLKEQIKQDNYKYGFLHLLLDTWMSTKGIFYETESIKKFTQCFFEEQNVVKKWFDEHYEINESSRIKSSILFNHFKQSNKDISQTKFGKEIGKICKSIKSSGVMNYYCKARPEEQESQFEKDL
jgi:P4 family phage/plasmid primase-like protien